MIMLRRVLVAINSKLGNEPVNAIRLFVKAIITPFKLHILEDEQGSREADGQAEDVDQGIHLVVPKVAVGDFEVVA
jgi:hypothetical protein